MRLAFLICLALAPVAAHAEPTSITLADAIRIAIDHNPALAGARLDVEIAAARASAARGATDIVVSAEARWDGARSEHADTDAIAGGVAITRPFAHGGSVALRSDTELARATNAAPDDRSALLVELRHPLLRGWNGESAPAASIARTEAAHDIARLEAAAAASRVIRELVIAYWELAFAEDELAIHRGSLELAREQLRVTKARAASGSLSGSETLAVGQAIALREDEVEQARAAVAGRALALSRLLGSEAQVALAPADRPPPGPARDVARERDAALARSPELALVRVRGRAAAVEVELAEDGMLPALDLVASVGVRGAGSSAGEVWHSLAARGTPTYAAGLELSLPLAATAARGARAAARRGARRVKLDERALALELEASVVQAATVLESARRRIAILDGAIALADRAIAAERARWEEGRSNNYEVMRRQAERADGELRRARARTDLAIAEASLDALTGAILRRYRLGLGG